MTRPVQPTHREQLGEDLWRLVEETGASLTGVEQLTTLFSERLQRASFRLSFADGRRLKGRRTESADLAERVADLLPLLDRQHFPRLIGRHGAALLVEWIEGPTAEAMDTALLEQCGAVLGALHRVRPPAGLVERHGFVAAHWTGRLSGNLQRLVELGALEPDAAGMLLAAARANAPTDPPLGLVHGDFCPENIVLRGPKTPAVVDNETLAIDVVPYDLGRTWHRWSMDPGESEAFLRGYGRFRDPSDYLEHRLYWDVAVLGEAAVFRLAGETGGGTELVRRLKGLMERQR